MQRLFKTISATGTPVQTNFFNPTPCSGRINKVEGYYNGPNPCFLHFFDQISQPTAGLPAAADVYTVQLFSNDGFSFDEDIPFLVAPWLVLSSAEDRFTAIGGGGVADFQVWMDVYELQNDPQVGINTVTNANAVQTVGDLTTGRNSLQVWATASGPQNLRRVDFNNSSGTQRWLMLFTNDAPVNGDKPFLVFPLEKHVNDAFDGTFTASYSLGDAVFTPQGIAQGATTVTQGCTLWSSTTGDVLTKDTTATAIIRALFTAV